MLLYNKFYLNNLEILNVIKNNLKIYFNLILIIGIILKIFKALLIIISFCYVIRK